MRALRHLALHGVPCEEAQVYADFHTEQGWQMANLDADTCGDGWQAGAEWGGAAEGDGYSYYSGDGAGEGAMREHRGETGSGSGDGNGGHRRGNDDEPDWENEEDWEVSEYDTGRYLL